jgi:hypothetical protein
VNLPFRIQASKCLEIGNLDGKKRQK